MENYAPNEQNTASHLKHYGVMETTMGSWKRVRRLVPILEQVYVQLPKTSAILNGGCQRH